MHTKIKLIINLIHTTYYNFDCNLYCVTCNSYKMIQYGTDCQQYHNIIMTENGISNNVCAATIVIAKLFTNIELLGMAMRR